MAYGHIRSTNVERRADYMNTSAWPQTLVCTSSTAPVRVYLSMCAPELVGMCKCIG
jgi:hypothetical protein